MRLIVFFNYRPNCDGTIALHKYAIRYGDGSKQGKTNQRQLDASQLCEMFTKWLLNIRPTIL